MESGKREWNEINILIEIVMNKKKQFVVCINNDGYPASLELHKIYRVLPDPEAEADGDLRVIDESGEDYLFPRDGFVFVELPREVEKSVLDNAGI